MTKSDETKPQDETSNTPKENLNNSLEFAKEKAEGAKDDVEGAKNEIKEEIVDKSKDAGRGIKQGMVNILSKTKYVRRYRIRYDRLTREHPEGFPLKLLYL